MADNRAVSLTVVSLAGFQFLNTWNNNAPSLSELRGAPPGDVSMKQRLIDADVMVGGTALILGGALSIMTHDNTPLVIMLTLFGSVALWHHIVLNGEAV